MTDEQRKQLEYLMRWAAQVQAVARANSSASGAVVELIGKVADARSDIRALMEGAIAQEKRITALENLMNDLSNAFKPDEEY